MKLKSAKCPSEVAHSTSLIPPLYCNQFKRIQRIKHFFIYREFFLPLSLLLFLSFSFLFLWFLKSLVVVFFSTFLCLVACSMPSIGTNKNEKRKKELNLFRKNFQRFLIHSSLLRFFIASYSFQFFFCSFAKWLFSCLVLLDCFPFNFNFYCNFSPFFFFLLFFDSLLCCCCCCVCILK